MNEKDGHSVIINIPRSRVFYREPGSGLKKKDTKKKVFAKIIRKPSEWSLRKYSLPDNKPLHVVAFQKDHLFLPYKLYEKKQEIIKHKQRLGIKINEKYKIINIDLRKRLHVEDPPDDVRAIADIDNTFFRFFDSRLLVQYIPLYKSLKYLFHKQLRMRQEVGYRNDCILNIEVNHRNELQSYENCVQKYTEQLKHFDAFISQDYQKSMAYLKRCGILTTQVNAEILKLQNLANKQFTIQSRLIGLDYMYFLQQKYGRFLYYLSPPSWRSKNREFAHSIEIEAKGFDLGGTSEEDTFNVLFEKMQKECFGGLVKPVLYFNTPENVMAIFEGIARQQLHHFCYVNHVAPHTKSLKKGIKKLKNDINYDTTAVVQEIKDLEKLLELCEVRASQLQAKFMKILYGLFYDSVASTDVLKLQLHLEFCFEKLYGEKSLNTSLMSNAKAVEKMYMEYSYKLDAIHNSKIKLAMKQCMEREKNKLKQAKAAARELRFFENLERALLRAHEPSNANHYCISPSPVVRRHPTRKAHRTVSSKTAGKSSSQRQLTDAEIEYLSLFTEWTVNEDPANYLQSLTNWGDKDIVH